MNKSFFKSLAVAGAFAAAANAQAAVEIGGIVFDPGFHIEVASLYENPVFAVGQTLGGYGEVTQINGSAGFCAGGLGTCELTYQFGGYVVSAISPTSITFTGGWVNFYVGTGANNDFNPFVSVSSAADLAAATNGALWLTLVGHDNGGFTLQGGGANIGTNNAIGSGGGLLDVDFTGLANGNTVGAGALANGNFNSNTQSDLLGGFADIQFSSSFGTGVVPHPGECQVGILTSCLPGSATMRGLVIPEPASLALIGAGLLIGGMVSRRRKQA